VWRRVEKEAEEAEMAVARTAGAEAGRAVADALEELHEAARQWMASQRDEDRTFDDESTKAASAKVTADSAVMDEITTRQAADRLGVTPQRVTQLIAAGALEARRPGRSWLVDRRSVDGLLSERSTG
jgi:excisionase family DNA binding protein